jgi:hypothetical protein
MTRPLAIAFVIALLAASCSPEKRLNKLIANHPELRDTVYVHDTLVTKEVQKDTLFVSVPGDTVKVDEGKMHIRYVRLPGDTVWLEGQCDPDTVINTITVERIAPTMTKSVVPWWVWVVIMVLAVVLLIQTLKR